MYRVVAGADGTVDDSATAALRTEALSHQQAAVDVEGRPGDDAASSEHSQAVTAATSSGRPGRPDRTLATAAAHPRRVHRVHGRPAIAAGATALTVSLAAQLGRDDLGDDADPALTPAYAPAAPGPGLAGDRGEVDDPPPAPASRRWASTT